MKKGSKIPRRPKVKRRSPPVSASLKSRATGKPRNVLAEIVERFGEDIVKLDGYDDCIAGIATRFNMEPIIIYDQEKIFRRLMTDGMTRLDAIEYFDFNIIGAWVGDRTPAFLERI